MDTYCDPLSLWCVRPPFVGRRSCSACSRASRTKAAWAVLDTRHRRLPAAVVAAQPDAEALHLARRAVRHLAAAPGEARHPRRRAEDPRHAASAERLTRQGHPAPRARTPAAARLLSNGADAPTEPQNPNPPDPRYAPTNRPQTRWGSNATASPPTRRTPAVRAGQPAW